MLKFDNVSKKFGDGTTALENIDFAVEKGEFVFLTGPSGAGKTTLLRLLIKEFSPSKGKIYFQDNNIADIKKSSLFQLRRKVGAVFQDFKILTDRTVEENIFLVYDILGKQKGETNKKTEQLLNMVGLEDKNRLFPKQLAGGELQRLALARSLALDPDLIFADEPTGNLDPETAWQIIELLKKINEKGTTLLVATHNYEIVDSLSQRVIRLEKGKIVSDEKKGKYKK